MINFSQLPKSEIAWAQSNNCKHGHTYLAHPNCYQIDRKRPERIGILDIEATNLNASFGYILSYCIKKLDGTIIARRLSTDEIKNSVFDEDLVEQFLEDLKKFDRVVTWYGTKFDIPFLRSRCLFWNVDFPIDKTVKHTDLYYISKFKLKLHSNRLQAVCDFLGIKSKGHPMTPRVWSRAMAGDDTALKYILTHNKEDVVSTEKVYNKIIRYSGPQTRSI